MLVPPALRNVLKPETLHLTDSALNVKSKCGCGNKVINAESLMTHIKETYNTSDLIDKMIDSMKLIEFVGGQFYGALWFLRTNDTHDGIKEKISLKTVKISDIVFEARILQVGDIITGFAFPTFSHIKKLEIIKDDESIYSCTPDQSGLGIIKICPIPLPYYHPLYVRFTLDEPCDMGSVIVAEYIHAIGLNRSVLIHFGEKYITDRFLNNV